MKKVYLCTCYMSGDVSNRFFRMANNVKQDDVPKTIITPSVLWLQHKELGIKIEHFSDALMQIPFWGVTKHLIVHVDRVFGNKTSNYWTFCRIISEHIKIGKDISLDWCPIADFADADSISITGWQSAQYVAFLHLSLVYLEVGGRFWWHYWQNKCKNISTGLCCLVPSYFVPLFGVCLQSGAGWWLCQAFLSSCVCYGMSTNRYQKFFSQKGEKEIWSSFLQRHLKLFQSAQLEVLDLKIWFSQKPVGRRTG